MVLQERIEFSPFSQKSELNALKMNDKMTTCKMALVQPHGTWIGTKCANDSAR